MMDTFVILHYWGSEGGCGVTQTFVKANSEVDVYTAMHDAREEYANAKKIERHIEILARKAGHNYGPAYQAALAELSPSVKLPSEVNCVINGHLVEAEVFMNLDDCEILTLSDFVKRRLNETANEAATAAKHVQISIESRKAAHARQKNEKTNSK